MIYARKGNRVSRIEEHQIANLVEQGFDIIDENGTVLHNAVPTDPALLKKYYIEHTARIADLEKEIESLKKSSSSKKSVVKEEKVAEPVDEVATEITEEKADEDVVAKPKRGRK